MNKKCLAKITNVGWTLGNDCPLKCRQCYSLLVRSRGRNLQRSDVDRVISELVLNDVTTVNIGGNEPLFTNGLDPKKTLLPYVIESLSSYGIKIGLTSAGITINHLSENHPRTFSCLSDVDVSLDSPFQEEHDSNRGARLFDQALSALEECRKKSITHTIVMCGMNWNLSLRHMANLVRLAKETGSYVRINFLKPTEEKHRSLLPTKEQYLESIKVLLDLCNLVDLSEPLFQTSGCKCGITSCRINSITPDGKIPISPCVYMHDFRTGNLLTESFQSIVNSMPFRLFRQRQENPKSITECFGCPVLKSCMGGCSARAYCVAIGGKNERLKAKDPYCPAEQWSNREAIMKLLGILTPSENLVHQNYLCTIILRPK